MYNNSTNSISVQYSGANGDNSEDMEISYNLVESGGGKVTINSNQTAVGNPVYIYRNTFISNVMQNKVTATHDLFR